MAVRDNRDIAVYENPYDVRASVMPAAMAMLITEAPRAASGGYVNVYNNCDENGASGDACGHGDAHQSQCI